MLYTTSDSINSIAIVIPDTISGIADSIHSLSSDLNDTIEKTNVDTNNMELITQPTCKNIMESTNNVINKNETIVIIGNRLLSLYLFIGNPQLVQLFALSLTSFPHSGHLIAFTR